ncbi:hypothetical protein F4778DRAFT_134225 [Xylariomycetidae sp. FL2044]|nr:hypothetical protein F4778DRAFT_134225 [Xylariomycetidae sp. FL2044]
MTGTDDPGRLPVLIIGAGACGLAIAHGLQNIGVPFKLFERDTGLAPRGSRDWALACHWSAPTLASLLGEALWSRIEEAQADPNTPTPDVDVVKVFNGRTGAVENELPFQDFRRFNRSRLRALMSEGLDVAYGKRLERISYPPPSSSSDDEQDAAVTAHFTDGTAETGRLIVGADGSQSRVRTLLLGAERAKLNRLPLAATFVTASYTRERALALRAHHPLINVILHPDDMVGMLATLDASDAARPETWRFQFYISWRATAEEQAREAAIMGVPERLAQVKVRSEAFADPLRSAFDWLPDDCDTVYWAGVANWDPSLEEHDWTANNGGGRVTLVGDAAHPMSYHRAQGLNHAIADAGKLVELLASQVPAAAAGAAAAPRRSQADLIREFETEMRARGGEEVRLSEMNSFMLHDFAKVEQSPLFNRGLKFGSGGKNTADG